MSNLAQVVSLLQDLGAGRVSGAGPPAGSGVGGVEESLWQLGGVRLAIRAHPDGVIRVDEVLVASASLPAVLDAIANVKAREIRGTTRRPG